MIRSKQKKASRQKVSLAVPLYPDGAGVRKLVHAAEVVREVQQKVREYQAAQGAGGPSCLRATRVGRNGKPSRQKPWMSQEQLLAKLTVDRDEQGWGQILPASSIKLAGLRTWAEQGPLRSKEVGIWIPFDGGVWAPNDYQVRIHALGADALQWCDTFALPKAYSEAFQRRQHRHLIGEAGRYQQASERFLAGDQEALRDHIKIGGRVAPSDLGVVTGRAALNAVVETPDQPRCLEQASIRRVMQAWGELGWELVINFAAPEHVPQASLVDTIGIDVGADNLLSLASSTEEYRLPQRLVHLPLPEVPSPSQGVAPTPFSAAQGLACRRQVIFDAFRPAYEAAIRRSLKYERIALEDTHWRPFGKRKFRFDLFAREIHLHTAIHWLEALAPLHGCEVVRINPRLSSRTCHKCGCVARRRTRRGRMFRCKKCKHTQHPDGNASCVFRQRGRRPQDPE
ncbi:zinc ribbon domain-containing protein (plasmid) [Deinococcus radiomollis]|uniref:zinc ribbon domain-containing protein n=1 Tax=Deinococcus radiomollis TaxID=468916 RepID=UPI003891A401